MNEYSNMLIDTDKDGIKPDLYPEEVGGYDHN